MVVVAAVGLFAGVMGGKYGAKASTGFARNLRKAMYDNIQTFSFASIDKYSKMCIRDRYKNVQLFYIAYYITI